MHISTLSTPVITLRYNQAGHISVAGSLLENGLIPKVRMTEEPHHCMRLGMERLSIFS